jgi:ATP-dependent DNA helicase RecG
MPLELGELPLSETERVEFKTSLAELKQGLISRAALREAIINGFCHREWREPVYIQIAIYKNRVEIRNPGGLFDGLTFEEMLRGNVSHRRNPLIADLFSRIDMVEAWGRGMPLILENAPDVEFREIARLFVASFERPSATVEAPQEMGLEPPENAKETHKKHQRTGAESLAGAARRHRQSLGIGTQPERSQCAPPPACAAGRSTHSACRPDQGRALGSAERINIP